MLEFEKVEDGKYKLESPPLLRFELDETVLSETWELRTYRKYDGIEALMRIHILFGSITSVGIDLAGHMATVYNLDVSHKLE